ncbi:MAG: glycosyltransferase family 9 protein [Prevotella sp.]|nr:glycosyltransferase family 9 protein [Prevotella sp.]
MKILVVRFRQMGDAILATSMLSTLKKSFPDAEIHFVLNERIAPLFEGHPAISRIITFSDDERHSFFIYIKKVWHIVHQTRYDAIIDMRSTLNTMFFALFSIRSKWRIGIRKPYTRGIFNYLIKGCEDDESMIDHNLKLISSLKPTITDRNLSLYISEKEKADFREYMQQQGIDFCRPVMLVGVTAKLEHKTWPEDRMTEVLRRIITTFPQLQLIFNFAPGREAENAQRIYSNLLPLAPCPSPLFLNIEAKSPRQLAAMAANCTAYFGNEGGGRHIVYAMGKPSLVICSPYASKTTWLPQDMDIVAQGIEANEATIEVVWEKLLTFCKQLAV